jgi:hypothetical protein
MTDSRSFVDLQLAVTDAGGRVDLSPGGILGQRLAVYQDRLARVHARGGEYAKVEFSQYVQDLLLRLEAGGALSKGIH